MKQRKGLSLVELLITVTILGIIMPVIYNTLINVQLSANGSNNEIELQTQTRLAMQEIVQDIRQSRAIFDQNVSQLAVFKANYMDDAVTGTYFTANDGSDRNALSLMKYSEKTIIAGKEVSQYKFIAYYMKLLSPDDSQYDPKSRLRAIVRLTSKETYIDPSFLTASEQTTALNSGFYLWTPPKGGITPSFPVNISVNYRKLTINTAPGNTPVNGIITPAAGGLIFSQVGNSVKIMLISSRLTSGGLKYIVLNSQSASRNFVS